MRNKDKELNEAMRRNDFISYDNEKLRNLTVSLLARNDRLIKENNGLTQRVNNLTFKIKNDFSIKENKRLKRRIKTLENVIIKDGERIKELLSENFLLKSQKNEADIINPCNICFAEKNKLQLTCCDQQICETCSFNIQQKAYNQENGENITYSKCPYCRHISIENILNII